MYNASHISIQQIWRLASGDGQRSTTSGHYLISFGWWTGKTWM
jgi:hypothetical protein